MLTAICIVDFHLTEGQRVEACHPPGALDGGELAAVAMHAFPDSMSFELSTRSSVRDTSFCFLVPRSDPGEGPLHGFVCCRQRQDPSLPRGGEQRSVVVLSPFPLSSLLAPLAQHAGALALARGAAALPEIHAQAAAWPLEWGAAVELPLGRSVLRAELPELAALPAAAAGAAARAAGLPSAADALADELDLDTGIPLCLLPAADELDLPYPGSPSAAAGGGGGAGSQASPRRHQPLTAGHFTDADVFTPLASCLRQLWALWEATLLGEPVMVAAPSPPAASAACAALVALLAPLPYSAEYRPYFTIHDPSFGALAAGALPGGQDDAQNPKHPKLPALLGVTSPLVLKSLSHWPNVLATGYALATQIDVGHSSSQVEEGGGGGEGGGLGRRGSGLLRRASLPALLRRVRSSPQTLLADPTDGIWMAYKALARPDVHLLASLALPEAGDGAARRRRLAALNSRLIRQHFEELNRGVAFLLLPFITPVPPPQDGAAAAAAAPPPLPDLDAPALVEGLASGGVAAPEALRRRFASRQDLARFFDRLLRSAAGKEWLRARRAGAAAFQAATWREAWRHAGGAYRLPGLSSAAADEVGGIEEFMAAEAALRASAAATAAEGGAADAALVARVRTAFAALPADLQGAMAATPGTRELLDSLPLPPPE